MASYYASYHPVPRSGGTSLKDALNSTGSQIAVASTFDELVTRVKEWANFRKKENNHIFSVSSDGTIITQYIKESDQFKDRAVTIGYIKLHKPETIVQVDDNTIYYTGSEIELSQNVALQSIVAVLLTSVEPMYIPGILAGAAARILEVQNGKV